MNPSPLLVCRVQRGRRRRRNLPRHEVLCRSPLAAFQRPGFSWSHGRTPQLAALKKMLPMDVVVHGLPVTCISSSVLLGPWKICCCFAQSCILSACTDVPTHCRPGSLLGQELLEGFHSSGMGGRMQGAGNERGSLMAPAQGHLCVFRV